jgi:hypothetical protein
MALVYVFSVAGAVYKRKACRRIDMPFFDPFFPQDKKLRRSYDAGFYQNGNNKSGVRRWLVEVQAE